MQKIVALLNYNSILTYNHTLLIGMIFLVSAISAFAYKKQFAATILLMISSAFISYTFISFDPFLNSWDERFHALVAKNMIEHPLKPVLYADPIISYDYKNWTGNNVWLHKQPLFLWQIALSIKLFGLSEKAVRLPSLVMLCLLTPIVVRTGKLLFNHETGFIAAVLLITNNFILEHVSGRQQIEHNDITFMFYLISSVWAWLEYENSGKKHWLFIAAALSGCSILVKWVTGLLFYAGYGFYHSLVKRDLWTKDKTMLLIASLFITIAVTAPWQLYTATKFPLEASYEHAFNAKHFWDAIEGHGGGILFYVKELNRHFGFFYPFILIGMVLMLFKTHRYTLGFTTAVMVIAFYVFFTAAATKMTSFVMPVAPLCFIFIGYSFNRLLHLFKEDGLYRPALTICLISIASIHNVNANEAVAAHWRNPESEWGRFFQNTADNTVVYKNLSKDLSKEYVIAYCNQFEEIDCMFYSGITAYSWLDEKKIKELKSSGKKLAVFKSNLPEFIVKDSSIVILPYDYKANKAY